MPDIPLSIQLGIAGGVLALTLGAIAFLLRQVKDLVPVLRPPAPTGSTQPEDVLAEVKAMSHKVDNLCEWHEPGRAGIPKEVDFGKIQYQVGAMHDLLSQRDRDGVPLVYIRVSLYEVIEAIGKILEKNTQILERIEKMLTP